MKKIRHHLLNPEKNTPHFVTDRFTLARHHLLSVSEVKFLRQYHTYHYLQHTEIECIGKFQLSVISGSKVMNNGDLSMVRLG
jgi:hypothetical protein